MKKNLDFEIACVNKNYEMTLEFIKTTKERMNELSLPGDELLLKQLTEIANTFERQSIDLLIQRRRKNYPLRYKIKMKFGI